ncbi:MAG: hypothetical protein K9H25_11490 [Rhodospirillum sp.]|nr:hypothetical protein [Rhodospirillum sp.]MCF8489823.1 hypothetical protein [Rhodospirillum sp.]MCF8501063.1 hypothetical protein [Rhodospirillum sp.]
MIFGRLIGWVLLAVAILIASGEAVLALGTGSYEGLATREVWTLLAGSPTISHSTGGMASRMVSDLLEWPAWTVIGAVGLGLAVLCRPPRRRRIGFRERSFG